MDAKKAKELTVAAVAETHTRLAMKHILTKIEEAVCKGEWQIYVRYEHFSAYVEVVRDELVALGYRTHFAYSGRDELVISWKDA